MIQEGTRLVEAAREKAIEIKLVGSVGVHMHCVKSRGWMVMPSVPVIEIAGRQEAGEALRHCWRACFEPRMRLFEMRHPPLHHPQDAQRPVLHIFQNAYEVFHRFEFLDVLPREPLTLPVTQLLPLAAGRRRERDGAAEVGAMLSNTTAAGSRPKRSMPRASATPPRTGAGSARPPPTSTC
jgi:hypothetical protein